MTDEGTLDAPEDAESPEAAGEAEPQPDDSHLDDTQPHEEA